MSHKSADLTIRGDFSLDKDQIENFLAKAKEDGLQELIVISTCNRTELMGIVHDPKILIDYLCSFSGGKVSVFLQKGYVLSDRNALDHIFRVGCGLDSQIIGDFEIIGQLKEVFQIPKNSRWLMVFLKD